MKARRSITGDARTATGLVGSAIDRPSLGFMRPAAQARDTLRLLAAQQMPSRHEQIGQCAGDDEAMSVLCQSAVAYLDEAEHPFDDPNRMLDPGAHLRLGAVFRPLSLVHHTTMAVAAIDEVARPRSAPPNDRPLTAISLITPHAGLLPMQQIGQYRAAETLAGV